MSYKLYGKYTLSEIDFDCDEGLTIYEADKKLIEDIEQAILEYSGEKVALKKTIRGYKNKGNKFTFTVGGGYDWVSRDLLCGELGEAQKIVETLLLWKLNKNIKIDKNKIEKYIKNLKK